MLRRGKTSIAKHNNHFLWPISDRTRIEEPSIANMTLINYTSWLFLSLVVWKERIGQRNYLSKYWRNRRMEWKRTKEIVIIVIISYWWLYFFRVIDKVCFMYLCIYCFYIDYDTIQDCLLRWEEGSNINSLSSIIFYELHQLTTCIKFIPNGLKMFGLCSIFNRDNY